MQSQNEALQAVKVEKIRAERQCERAQDRLECVICNDGERSFVFLPCSHVVACAACAAPLEDCPICRVEIAQKVSIKMS